MATRRRSPFATERKPRVLASALALTLCVPALAPLVVIGFAAISPDVEIW
jgi:hypothetical protein